MGAEHETSESDITLKITVRLPDGSPYPGAVDVECQHQTLSDRREYRGLNASRTIVISGLRRVPQGLYRVTVTPVDVFTPEGQFVNIPASGFAELEFVFRVAPPAKPEVRIVDENGSLRTDIGVGESLLVRTAGLAPSCPYSFLVSDDTGRSLFPAVLLSDRYGTIESTDLWPQVGLNDPFSQEDLTIEEAVRRWKGRRLRIELRKEGAAIARTEIPLAPTLSRPLLVGTDGEGHLRNAVETAKADAIVSAFNAPFHGPARVYMVASQQNWAPGNRFAPVRLASGREAFADVDIDGGGHLEARVARARELRPGSYDFIVRQLRYGYEDDEDLILRADDLVTRTVTGLVVRMDFMASKAVRGGCINMLPISGRNIAGPPYFQYADTFQIGEDVYGALDPLAIDPNLVGKMVAYYVIPHKAPGQWLFDKTLNNLAVLGGNAAVQLALVQAGCINHSKRRLWPSASLTGEYDIVADFGNNTADPLAFTPDNLLTSPTDIVDGVFVTGFRVVPDPTMDTRYTHAGKFEYNDGSLTVTDDFGVPVTLDKQAVVYFPADGPGATTPTQISATQADYPVIVAVHGNSTHLTSYQGYNYLLEHWARNGFIAASIHLKPDMAGTGRARVLFAHLAALKLKFGAKAANNIGLMGHSRGGEAVAIAARLNHNENLNYGIHAIVSLAPTDQYTHESLGGGWATPYMVIYGAMDGDLGDGPAFRLYDRASGQRKCMVFVYGSLHDPYNTVWDRDDTGFGQLGDSDFGKLISNDAHQLIAKGYMTAFFRCFLKNETQWDGIFTGEWKPAAVEAADSGKVRLYIQYQDATPREIDNFEGAHSATSWQTSTIGGAVDDSNTLPVDPQEGSLATLDSHSPHDTAGLLLRWDGTSDNIRWDVPVGPARNVSTLQALSFRITQKVGSAFNPAGLPQDLYVALRDTGGKSRSIKVGRFAEIPAPQDRYYAYFTKSAMRTVRIPLPVYTIAVAGTTPVDLTAVDRITFEFAAQPTGEVEIDSIEFTN